MSTLSFEYDTSTGAVIAIQWSSMGDAAKRKQRFGGYINSWDARKVGDSTYLIPKGVTVQKIHKALTESLLPSDRAVASYPHGSDKAGSSAMRIRLYGKAVSDADR